MQQIHKCRQESRNTHNRPTHAHINPQITAINTQKDTNTHCFAHNTMYKNHAVCVIYCTKHGEVFVLVFFLKNVCLGVLTHRGFEIRWG